MRLLVRTLRSLLRIAALTGLGSVLLFGGLGAWGFHAFRSDLPRNLDVVTDYRPLRASQIFSADGEVIGEFFVEKRVLLGIDHIPQLVRQAFVAAEDERFYQHHGVDYWGIVRAAIANARAGQVVQGGSSITQQVAKLLLVGKERSLARKIREALLAIRIETELDKDQILGIYLNHVYLGHGAYGIAAAANAYFGKRVSDLTVAEAAMLAALPKAPSRITPFHAFERARARQRYVLGQMKELGMLGARAAQAARNEPLVLVASRRTLTTIAAPYFVETVRKDIAARYGEDQLLGEGLRITTTLNMRLQRAAEAAVRRGLENLARQLGFSGPVGHLDPTERASMRRGRPRPISPTGFDVEDAEQAGSILANVVDLPADETAPPRSIDPDTTYAAVVTALEPRAQVASGALTAALEARARNELLAYRGPTGERIRVGDILPVRFSVAADTRAPARRGAPARRPPVSAVLAATPTIEGALVALDPATGHLLAMVGGYDWGRSQFNRATQARRQIGSAIKPFVYATAIDRGATSTTIRTDAPVRFRTSSGVWAPGNYKPEYRGRVTLRTAFAQSLNTVSAQLVAHNGVDSLIEVIRAAGVSSRLPRALSLSLGTADLGLAEMAYALATFPAQGRRVAPLSIVRVVDADGKVLERHAASATPPRALTPEVAYILTDMMKDVVERGTARKAKALGRPLAGKTGTSTNYRDAWFFGFSPDLLCGVWVGRDDFLPIGNDVTGGRAALPIWMDFMEAALRDRPAVDFPIPPGIVLARVNPNTGRRAAPGDRGSEIVPFRKGKLLETIARPTNLARFPDHSF